MHGRTSAAANAFKPFSGAAKRIDGKLTTAAQEAKMAGLPSACAGGSASASAATNTDAKAESKTEEAPVYQSRIGDKYSKKKTAVSAFTGTAHKLN